MRLMELSRASTIQRTAISCSGRQSNISIRRELSGQRQLLSRDNLIGDTWRPQQRATTRAAALDTFTNRNIPQLTRRWVPVAAMRREEVDELPEELIGYGEIMSNDDLPKQMRIPGDLDWNDTDPDEPINYPKELLNTEENPIWEPWDRHEDLEGRCNILDLEEGSVYPGTVTAMAWGHGIFVDVGADYDGLIFVEEEDVQDIVDVVDIDMKVEVRVRKIHSNTKRFVFPLELDMVSPDISEYLIEPELEYPPVYWYDDEVNNEAMLENEDLLEKYAEEIGRPIAGPEEYKSLEGDAEHLGDELGEFEELTDPNALDFLDVEAEVSDIEDEAVIEPDFGEEAPPAPTNAKKSVDDTDDEAW